MSRELIIEKRQFLIEILDWSATAPRRLLSCRALCRSTGAGCEAAAHTAAAIGRVAVRADIAEAQTEGVRATTICTDS